MSPPRSRPAGIVVPMASAYAPTRSRATIQVAGVGVATRSVGQALLRLLRRRSLEYRFTGSGRFGTPVGEYGAPFDERGTSRP